MARKQSQCLNIRTMDFSFGRVVCSRLWGQKANTVNSLVSCIECHTRELFKGIRMLVEAVQTWKVNLYL